MLLKNVYQKGAAFYDEESGELVADYAEGDPAPAGSDLDTRRAVRARRRFAKEHPQHVLAEDEAAQALLTSMYEFFSYYQNEVVETDEA